MLSLRLYVELVAWTKYQTFVINRYPIHESEAIFWNF